MIRFTQSFLILISTILIVGCGSISKPEPEPEIIPEPVVVEPNPEILRALSEIRDIKQELRQLRNSVEEMQFENSNANRRQQDLFQDLDRRLVGLERNQQALASSNNNTDASNLAVGDANLDLQQNDSLLDQDTTQGNADGVSQSSTANQVVVVDSNNSTSTNSGSSSQISDASSTSSTVTLAEQQAYDAAFEMLKQSRYEDAVFQFQQYVDTWPNSLLADDAFYWMSEARYVNREFEQALSGFRTVATQYPSSQRVPEAMLKIGYIQYDIGAYDDAADTFRDILTLFPGHQVTVSAQTRLRRIEKTIQ